MARAGVAEVYTEAQELLEQLLCIEVSRTQVYRVTHHLGEQLETGQTEAIIHEPLVEGDVVYASMDGSMLQTEEGWKEVKLGRVFKASDVKALKSKVKAEEGEPKQRHRIAESIYSAYLGSCHEFLPRFDASLGTLSASPQALVFITDGAEWIHNYLQKTYPKATLILDYFHAVERLGELASKLFKQEEQRSQWVEEQEQLLKAGKVCEIIDTLKKLLPFDDSTRKQRDELVTYYQNNQARMAYDQYRQRGLMIGSGPMEAAHRTVLQARMKRSGQHWKISGAKAMINLRVALKSGRWHEVIRPLKRAA